MQARSVEGVIVIAMLSIVAAFRSKRPESSFSLLPRLGIIIFFKGEPEIARV